MAAPRSAYLERKRALAAVERMQTAPGSALAIDQEDADAYARRHGLRPLRPPPVAIATPHVTAGAAELAKELRRGTYVPAPRKLYGGEP